MENQKNTSYEQDSHTEENPSFIRDYQNPQYNPDQENDNLDNTESHLYPDQNRNSLNSNSVNTLDGEEEEVEEEEDENDDDFNKEDFEEEGDFQEKDLDYREKKERDSF